MIIDPEAQAELPSRRRFLFLGLCTAAGGLLPSSPVELNPFKLQADAAGTYLRAKHLLHAQNYGGGLPLTEKTLIDLMKRIREYQHDQMLRGTDLTRYRW